MSQRARFHKAQLKLVTKFRAASASGMASIAAGMPSVPDTALFLIGRNKDGYWVAREENGCAGGVFFTERGARQYAARWANPLGCATRRVSQPLELDFNGEGNVLIRLIGALKGAYRVPEPLRDVISVVFGLAAVTTAVWLTITFLTLGR